VKKKKGEPHCFRGKEEINSRGWLVRTVVELFEGVHLVGEELPLAVEFVDEELALTAHIELEAERDEAVGGGVITEMGSQAA